MRSFLEIIYIASDGNARQTNLRSHAATNAETWAEFNRLRRYGVDIKKANFLLDYHNAKGDLADTVAIDATGFTSITGQQPKTEAEYEKIDDDFWDAVRADRKAA